MVAVQSWCRERVNLFLCDCVRCPRSYFFLHSCKPCALFRNLERYSPCGHKSFYVRSPVTQLLFGTRGMQLRATLPFYFSKDFLNHPAGFADMGLPEMEDLKGATGVTTKHLLACLRRGAVTQADKLSTSYPKSCASMCAQLS